MPLLIELVQFIRGQVPVAFALPTVRQNVPFLLSVLATPFWLVLLTYVFDAAFTVASYVVDVRSLAGISFHLSSCLFVVWLVAGR